MLIIASICVFRVNKENRVSSLVFRNIEALAKDGDDKIDCSYTREEPKCEVYVGVKGEIRVVGVGVLKAGADGYIRFDGKVICGRNGGLSCRPIECADIYEIIFKK